MLLALAVLSRVFLWGDKDFLLGEMEKTEGLLMYLVSLAVLGSASSFSIFFSSKVRVSSEKWRISEFKALHLLLTSLWMS